MKQTDKINEKADKNINSDTEERERKALKLIARIMVSLQNKIDEDKKI